MNCRGIQKRENCNLRRWAEKGNRKRYSKRNSRAATKKGKPYIAAQQKDEKKGEFGKKRHAYGDSKNKPQEKITVGNSLLAKESPS